MTTQIEITTGLAHLFGYCFDTINAHVNSQIVSKKNPFSLYMKDEHQKLKNTIPDISDRSKTIANNWKNASMEVKDGYQKLADNYMAEKKENIRKKREGGLNNFQFFCKVQRENFVPTNPNDKKQSTRELSIVWNTFDDTHKHKFKEAVDKYNNDKETYQALVKKLK